MRKNVQALLLATGAVALLAACGEEEATPIGINPNDRVLPNAIIDIGNEVLETRPAPNPDKNAYFGDLHVHTAYSFDAYVFGTTASPRDAYRYAKGEKLMHPGGFEVQLSQPLDFYAVPDHAMFMGFVKEAADTSTEASKVPFTEGLHNINAPDNMGITTIGARATGFGQFITNAATALADGNLDPDLVRSVTKSAWKDTVEAAEEYNQPGHFTTFVAYEYTSSTDAMGNLHRNVIFKSGDKVPAVPFSRFHSQNPEGLWDWMDGLRAQGIESLAIPHNSNGSNGAMFQMSDWAGQVIDAEYAMQRMRNEPIVEITQVKGTSDTHPDLAKNDEWADFEIYPFRIATNLPSEPQGSYVRQALMDGLAFEEKCIPNPYKFGLVGASDTHTGAASFDESNFFSKVGMIDGTGDLRGSVPLNFFYGLFMRAMAPDLIQQIDGKTYTNGGGFDQFGASGMTGVWAEENTRDEIYAAFRRKETFATSGTRIRVRFFGGYGLEGFLDDPAMVSKAYATGVSMGGELAGGDEAPGFLVWALADANAAPLQRVQIIKGWVNAAGETEEQVYDVACSDGGVVDPTTHRCPDNGARVNLADCSITQGVGAGELKTHWQDPDFVSGQRAFYYVRVLENPTCRWSTWDAVNAGFEPRSDLKKTIQERAWTSPIWITP